MPSHVLLISFLLLLCLSPHGYATVCLKLAKIIDQASQVRGGPGTPEQNQQLLAIARQAAGDFDGYLGSAIYFGQLVHFVRPGTSISELMRKMEATDAALVHRDSLGVDNFFDIPENPTQLKREFARALAAYRGYAGFEFSPEKGFTLYWDKEFAWPNPPSNFGPHPVAFVPVPRRQAEKIRKNRVVE